MQVHSGVLKNKQAGIGTFNHHSTNPNLANINAAKSKKKIILVRSNLWEKVNIRRVCVLGGVN